jgi:hypothetical protein
MEIHFEGSIDTEKKNNFLHFHWIRLPFNLVSKLCQMDPQFSNPKLSIDESAEFWRTNEW